MDNEAERAWLAFVRAEQAYRESMGALRHVDIVSVLREGLLNLPWRRPALAVLSSSSIEFSEQLLPELFQLASASHSLIGEVRRCILRVPRDRVLPRLEVYVRELIDDSASDYEAYRRIAELLSEVEDRQLLGVLIRAAETSPDADIREVAADFGEYDSDSAEARLAGASLEFIGALRLAEGFKEVLLDDLKEAIVDVGSAWKNDDCLPKSLVHHLIGLYAWIHAASYLYEGGEAERIRRAASEVEALVVRHVAPDPGEYQV